VGYLLLFVVFSAVFAADILLVRQRQFRFTLDLIITAIQERNNAASMEVSDKVINEAYVTTAVIVVLGVALSATGALWMDLSIWNPLVWVVHACCPLTKSKYHVLSAIVTFDGGANFEKRSSTTEDESEDGSSEILQEGKTRHPTSVHHDENASILPRYRKPVALTSWHVTRVDRARHHIVHDGLRHGIVLIFNAAVFLIALPLVVLVIADHTDNPTLADCALNSMLNEIFRWPFGASFLPDMADGTIASAELYLDYDTEVYQLAANDSLYRTTLGFRGDLAFDVSINASDPPNVLVLVVESFRYHDSQYLVANNTYLLKDTNITVTPQFDRWAKRGIAFHNFWSSWRTSRSVESILFGQLPYDSVTDSGTTGGRVDVELSGMPQLFKAKGYSTKFTTGCILTYDGWNKFFEPHGFDEVLGNSDFRQLAEKDLGIAPVDWALVRDGGKARAMSNWGVHDDVALEVLGNILINETAAQRERVANGEVKRPVFINHYTISSHTPFTDRPQWYDEMDKPDFSALYEGEEYADDIKNYLEMRYFTDMAIGEFLDRMQQEGVLNDTIVVITGDHGQAPEYGLDVPEAREISVTRVAATLIAEGRLDEHAGMMFTDAAEQYDLLNTLADIVGIPEGGFVQDGVGRSLKRKYQSKNPRAVYSNNPSRKLSIVIGDERLQYDARSSAVALHNVETDHDLQHDLFLTLNESARHQWRILRDNGRRLNGYFKKRWDGECLLSASC